MGSEDRLTLFLLLRPHFPGCSGSWPSSEAGTFVWSCSCLKTTLWDRTPVLVPAPLSRVQQARRAEKGLHPWQAQVTSASVGCGVGSLCQRACGRGPADSSVCDEGNGAAQGQEKSSLTRSPRHAPMAVPPGMGGNVATEENLASAGTRGLWFVIS